MRRVLRRAAAQADTCALRLSETISETGALQTAAAALHAGRQLRPECPFVALLTLALLVLGLLSGLSAYYVAQLRFNYNFNDFYPAGDPDLDYYQGYTRRFGNDNDYLLLGLEAAPGHTVFEPGFLRRVDSLTQLARRQAHVVAVTSPTTIANPVVEGLGFFNLPYLHPDEPARRAADSTLIYRTPGLVGNVFSPDARAVALVIQTTPDLKKPPGDSLLAGLRGGLARQFGFPEKQLPPGRPRRGPVGVCGPAAVGAGACS